LEFKWKSPFRFLLTGIFGTTSGGGPLISVGIFRPKFVVPFLTNRFSALIRELRRETNSGKSHSYWLARFNRKISFHFARKFPPISDRSVSHNGKHPVFPMNTTQCPWPGLKPRPPHLEVSTLTMKPMWGMQTFKVPISKEKLDNDCFSMCLTVLSCKYC